MLRLGLAQREGLYYRVSALGRKVENHCLTGRKKPHRQKPKEPRENVSVISQKEKLSYFRVMGSAYEPSS